MKTKLAVPENPEEYFDDCAICQDMEETDEQGKILGMADEVTTDAAATV
ncbi:hypothetical protein HYU94_03700 [Candidatus Daviesbacteria bacterium]|nr:hypothetical protein [Candidatus Daviesbacteria bacterium]